MGRALARNPSIFLFDEPLSNLDAKLRVQTRLELKKQGMTEFTFGKHYQSLSDEEMKKEWDDFSSKALQMVCLCWNFLVHYNS